MSAASESPPATVEQAYATLAQLAAASALFDVEGLRAGAAAAVEAGSEVAALGPGEAEERRLRLAEARYQVLIEQIPAVTFLASLAGDKNEIYVSPQIESLLGFTQEEWVSDPILWYRQIYPEDREQLSQEFATACVTGQPFRGVVRVFTRGGELRWVHAESRFVRDERGQLLFLQGVGFDVTEQFRAQEAREQLIREQAARAEADREREYLQELLTTRQRAEEEIRRLNVDLQRRAAELTIANKELEAFSYSVSHDLRAPLRSIDGFSQALLKRYADQLDAQGQNYLQRVCAASQRMSELIDDLLTLSRVTRAELHRDPVDLSALVAAVAAELQQRQPARQVDFVIAEGLVATGDARLLRAVLENLLGNAWKFTSKRDPARIEFGCTEIDGQPTYFVRDNGAGFDMSYADKLFSPFQRLHSADEFEGTGIGLATVQRIIHRHGGRIWAEGVVDQGATFYFTL